MDLPLIGGDAAQTSFNYFLEFDYLAVIQLNVDMLRLVRGIPLIELVLGVDCDPDVHHLRVEYLHLHLFRNQNALFFEFFCLIKVL